MCVVNSRVNVGHHSSQSGRFFYDNTILFFFSSLGMRVPRGVDSAPPRIWWDTECDVSLLVGTYIHGYENYLDMRSDPKLCFVDKLGPPDDAECTDIKYVL